MRNIYRSLLLLLAGATQKELARHVRYLKVENQILRSKLPKRVQVTPQERIRLTRFTAKLGGVLDELVSIVHPNTVRRWMHDNDGKFSQLFDDTLENAGLEARKTAIRSPNTVAFVERFVQTIKQEVLYYFIVFGQQHMDYLCSQFAEHYHEERPHQGLDNELLAAVPKSKKKSRRKAEPAECETIALSSVACKQRLGGLLKHYYRKAA